MRFAGQPVDSRVIAMHEMPLDAYWREMRESRERLAVESADQGPQSAIAW